MTPFRWSWPLLLLLSAVSSTSAQGIVVYNPYFTTNSLNYTRVGKHSALSLNVGYGVPAYGYYGPPPRYSYSSYFNSLSIVTLPPPVVILPREPRYDIVEELIRDLPRREVKREEEIPPPEEKPVPPLPGRDAGAFRALEPDNRDNAAKPIAPPAPPPEVLRLPPRPPPPDPNPLVESGRLLALGKTAFAAEEYGRAAERFRQAALLIPAEALPHFLEAQALLALGKYLEALDALTVGLTLKPDWARSRFQPRELFVERPAAYLEQLQRLEETLARHPNDAALLFLLGYERWFDFRQEEARGLFQRARPGIDPALVNRFLNL